MRIVINKIKEKDRNKMILSLYKQIEKKQGKTIFSPLSKKYYKKHIEPSDLLPIVDGNVQKAIDIINDTKDFGTMNLIGLYETNFLIGYIMYYFSLNSLIVQYVDIFPDFENSQIPISRNIYIKLLDFLEEYLRNGIGSIEYIEIENINDPMLNEALEALMYDKSKNMLKETVYSKKIQKRSRVRERDTSN